MRTGRFIKPPRRLLVFIIAYGLVLSLLTILNWIGPERWWFGAFNLYLPQAVWLVPIVPLTLISMKYARRLIFIQGIFLVWVCGPLMGIHWNFGPKARPAERNASFRVMTCNIKSGQRDITALMSDLARYKPQVVFLQDVESLMDGPLGAFFHGWDVVRFDQYVIASRLPLSKSAVRRISIPEARLSCLKARIQLGQTPVILYCTHLLTPRDGLNAFRAVRMRPGFMPAAIRHMQDNVEERLLQARALSDLVRKDYGAVIVAGDLNSPDPSLACRTLRDVGLHDSFAEGGRGYGYTYGHFLLRCRIPWMGLSWMRIDHIMLSRHLRSMNCWTGTSKASDHRPVFADLMISTA